MKRSVPWSDREDSDDDSSTSSSTSGDGDSPKSSGKRIGRKSKPLDFESLRKHGYKGGPSVLSVPQPHEEQDWKWSKGNVHRQSEEDKESYEERQKTRAALADGEQLANVETRKEKEKKNLSFSQKEKRKRDFGQASRGKNYVEEEKRVLRDNGVYSGFDT